MLFSSTQNYVKHRAMQKKKQNPKTKHQTNKQKNPKNKTQHFKK